jgi:type IV secretory pathway TraG/TraD family ATPase VirD4
METGHIVILLLFGAFIAYLIYYTLTHKEEEKKEVIKPSLEGLPSVPDPNPGYIRGAKFGKKNPLHQIALAMRFLTRYNQMDMGDAFIEACKRYGARPNDELEGEALMLTNYHLNIGDILIPQDAETKGFLVVGRPGTGKTQILSQILDILKDRNRKVIVHDFKGDYLQCFYNPNTDIVFNPLDTRCVPWDIFSKVQGPWDLESLATALIPAPISNTDQHWTDAARNVLIGAMTHLVQTGRACNSELQKLIADKTKMIEIIINNNLRGSEHLIGYPENKESQSVMSTFGRFTNCLTYLPNTSFGKKGCTFDFEGWILSDKGGTIFVTNYQRTEDALRPLLSIFIESFIRTILSLPDDLKRRIYVILDEFGRLNRLPSTSSLITQGRSKGCATFLGIQDLAQIETKYSKTIRQSISNSLGSHIVLQVVDPDTADYFSREIGDVTRLKTDYTRGTSEGYQSDGDSSSNYTSSQRTSQVTERLILPSEILAMKKLQAIVRLVDQDVLATRIPILECPPVADAFILNEKHAFTVRQATESKQTENKIESEEKDDEIKD